MARRRQTFTVVGFYDGEAAGEFLADSGRHQPWHTRSAAGNPHYLYSLKLDPDQADQKLHQIQKAVPRCSTFNLVELLMLINTLLNNLIIMLTAIASLAMLAGIIIIANAVALAMLERRRELGILKSVGFTSRSVLGEVLFENGVVGFTGALLAMLLATLTALVLGKVAFQVTGLGVSLPLVLGDRPRYGRRLHGRCGSGRLGRHARPPAGGAALRIASALGARFIARGNGPQACSPFSLSFPVKPLF